MKPTGIIYLQAAYVELVSSLNDYIEKWDQSRDHIVRTKDSTRFAAPSDSTLVSHLGYSDDDCKKLKENHSSRNSSTNSLKVCYVNENSGSRKRKANHVAKDRTTGVIALEAVDHEFGLNRVLSQRTNCENEMGDSSALTPCADPRPTKNGMVLLRHLYPENEDEDCDSEISRALAGARRKQKSKNMRKRTRGTNDRVVKKLDTKGKIEQLIIIMLQS